MPERVGEGFPPQAVRGQPGRGRYPAAATEHVQGDGQSGGPQLLVRHLQLDHFG
ncbi:hypothetical protein [Streptomyces sp. NPDC004042]|uniref:hypothetical protein n=1 Tax=Streptomyces sp. NPDC004042 TaxID=3154451 RepID=UPI0033B2A241